VDTWENLQARVFHLAWLAEELPAFVATPSGGWLFRAMQREAESIAASAADYVAECDRMTEHDPHTAVTDRPGAPGRGDSGRDSSGRDSEAAGGAL
jgi:hypothetical protein